MKHHKLWTLAAIGILGSFVAMNFIIWKLFTKQLMSPSVVEGDYTRVGYIYGSNYSNKEGYQLERKHIEYYEYREQPIDVLTIGDSFSNSCGKPHHGHINLTSPAPVSSELKI